MLPMAGLCSQLDETIPCPPPSPQVPLITAASTPAHPPFAPCSSISPLGVFRGGRGGTAAPRVLLGCSPMDFQPHGLPAPRMLTLCLQPPRLPPLCSLPYAACVCPWGPGLASLSPFNPKGRAGHLWAGGANKGVGWGEQGGGLAPPWGAVGAPSAPLLFLCSHSCSWFCIILYYSASPPPPPFSPPSPPFLPPPL